MEGNSEFAWDRARAGQLEGIGQDRGWCEGPASGQGRFCRREKAVKVVLDKGMEPLSSGFAHAVCICVRVDELWAVRYWRARCLQCRGRF